MDFLNPPNRTVLLGVRQDAAKQSGKAGKLLGAAIESASFLNLGVSARKKTTHCGSFLKGLKIPGENISVTHSPESTVLPTPHWGILDEGWQLKPEVVPPSPKRRPELVAVGTVVVYVGNERVGFYYRDFSLNGGPMDPIRWVPTYSHLLLDRPYAAQEDAFIYMDAEGAGMLDFQEHPPIFWCASLPPSPQEPVGESCFIEQSEDTTHSLTGEVFENFRTYEGKRRDMLSSPTYIWVDGNEYTYRWQIYFHQVTINSYRYHDPVMLPSSTLKKNRISEDDEFLTPRTKYFEYVAYEYRDFPWPSSLYEVGFSPAFGFLPETPIGPTEVLLGKPNEDWEQTYKTFFEKFAVDFQFHDLWSQLEEDDLKFGYIDGGFTPYWFVALEGPYPNARVLNDDKRVPARQGMNHRNYPDELTDVIMSVCREAKVTRRATVQVYLAAFTNLIQNYEEQSVFDPMYVVLDKELTLLMAASCGSANKPEDQTRNADFEKGIVGLLKFAREDQINRGFLVNEDENYPFLGRVGTYFTDSPSKRMEALLRILELTNNLRANNGLGSVEWDSDLQKACTRHAYDLAKNRIPAFLPHVGTDESTLSDRVWASGFGAGAERAFFYAGENLALDYRSSLFPDDVMNTWIWSPLHLANLVAPDFKSMGVDVVASEDGHMYWCQVFGHNQHRR